MLFLAGLAEGAHFVSEGKWDPRVPGSEQDWQGNSELVTLRNHSGTDFIFCALPKNGCTVWKQLMLRANNISHWNTTDKTLIHNPEKSGLDLVKDSEIFSMLGPESTALKAVIVRDPAVRFLSSYLDRCIDNDEWKRCLSEGPVPFEEVIANYEAQDPNFVRDIHFRNQVGLCGIQFQEFVEWAIIGKYEHFVNASQHILHQANLWHLYGEAGWGKDGKNSFGAEEQPMSNHPTGEHHTEDQMCEYYTPDLLQRVQKLYFPDYIRFHYEVTPWMDACSKKWSAKQVAIEGEGQNASLEF